MTAMMTMEETICGSVADTYSASVPVLNVVPNSVDTIEPVAVQFNVVPQGLSPRLEMRLALNRDIMGDEDLINYETGPDLSTILGHDLSTYHRMTARDIINRTVNRSISNEAQNIHSQQRNSKLDTPTPNRRKTNLNTWNSFASVDQGKSLGA